MSFFLIRLRREVRAREEAEQRADRYARHDPMTGFLNRRTFGNELDAELAALRERDQQGAVFFIEIEHLTSADNVYGQAAGEALLIEMASRIRNVLGSEAMVGRVRDDEFACLVEGDPDLVRERATELLQRLNLPLRQNGGSINSAATIGIACFPHHGSNSGSLLRSADIALCDARRAGRLVYRFFDPEQRREVPDSSDVGAHDQLSTFLSAAAMEAAIKASRRIAATWLGGTAVAVRLSADQLEDEWAANRLLTIMTCNGLQPSKLVVKVKESCFSAASSTAVHNLEILQRAGIRIVLSDFRNSSKGRSSSITFDHVELDDAYLTSQIVLDRGQATKVTRLNNARAPTGSAAAR
jgi:diguanylate cyclase (GGDEF)-like protein